MALFGPQWPKPMPRMSFFSVSSPFLRVLPLAWVRHAALLWCLTMLLMAWPASAASDSHPQLIVASAWWEDLSGQASVQEAQAQRYTPYQGLFNRGYTNSAHWIRLTLAASDTPIGLRLNPTWVDEITVYDPAQPGVQLTAGDRPPQGLQGAEQILGYSFVLPGSAEPRELLLRLRSTSAHRLLVQALPAPELPAAHTRAIVWTSLYSAVLLLMLLALVSVWWVQRERVLGVYLVRHCLYTFYALSYLGLPALLLPAGALPTGLLDTTFSMSVAATLPIGLWFDITLLSTYSPQRHLLALLKVLAWAGLASVALLLTGQARVAMQLTVHGLMLSSLLVFVCALSTRPQATVERLMPKKVMLAYYALILSSLLLGLVGVVGWKPAQTWSHYLLILHGLGSGLVMTVILFVRGQRQYRHSQQMSWQLQKTQQEMELEQRRRQEQSQFLHMLMHELKTPLSVVSLALGTKTNRQENLEHASRAIQDMKAIIERCVQADQVGQLTLVQHRQAVDVPALIREMGQHIPGLSERLRISAAPDLVQQNADAQLLRIILTNLLDNAARYSDPLTLVTVLVQVQKRQNQSSLQTGLCVRVCNTPGMAGWPDEQKLFEKYYRAVGAQRDSGSGLGLFLSRQLAQSLGGSLDYAPSSQQVEFVLWIPQTPA